MCVPATRLTDARFVRGGVCARRGVSVCAPVKPE